MKRPCNFMKAVFSHLSKISIDFILITYQIQYLSGPILIKVLKDELHHLHYYD
jgi:hypothetical protein